MLLHPALLLGSEDVTLGANGANLAQSVTDRCAMLGAGGAQGGSIAQRAVRDDGVQCDQPGSILAPEMERPSCNSGPEIATERHSTLWLTGHGVRWSC